MTVFRTVVVIVIIVFLLAFGIKQQIDINALNKEISELEKSVTVLKYENEKKQNQLDMTEEEFYKTKAKEEGYKDPDAKYYYNDFAG